ncbi:TRAP transporter large permease [Roseiarcaceae bacterium H3SJ34-1]|uniref:TRAP transporter large permease n=1 Tax=Terripilifer ovatus TaxID=3032367 RepID=UPI003AB92205|nr:TRAP transporter large permease [Roseiarcaceae bacterium H3SJ34-1]
MSALSVAGTGLLALLVLILMQVPVAFAMIIVGIVGFALQAGMTPALTILASETSGILSSVDLASIPLFLLMGAFASAAGFSDDVYRVASAFLSHRRGGLAYATIGGCAAFGAVCGSSTATAATFAKAALPQMLKRGYSPSLAAGSIAAGGTLKALIPPSVIMILYCVTAKTFINDLFLAAIVPALLTIGLNLAAIWIVVRLRPADAPIEARGSWPERRAAMRTAAPVLVLMLALFAGLYSGVFTVNEAASVAAVLSLAFALLRRRLSWATFWQGLRDAASATAMIYLLIIGASVFTYFISLARVPEALVTMIEHIALPPVAIIFMILAAYLVLGAIFDEIAAMLITLPLILPLIVKLGYDPIWWGIVNVVIIELGMIIPPIGLIVFILHGMAPQISLRAIYRGVTPFIIADLTVLVLLTLFPALATWLPTVFGRS